MLHLQYIIALGPLSWLLFCSSFVVSPVHAIILFPPNKSWKLVLVRSCPTVPVLFSCFNSNNHDIPTSTLLNFAYVPKATRPTNREPLLFVSSMMSWFPKASDGNTGFEGARYNYSQICIKISLFGRKKKFPSDIERRVSFLILFYSAKCSKANLFTSIFSFKHGLFHEFTAYNTVAKATLRNALTYCN